MVWWDLSWKQDILFFVLRMTEKTPQEKKYSFTYIDHIRHAVVLFALIALSMLFVEKLIDIDRVQAFIQQYPIRAPIVLALLKWSTIIIAPISWALVYSLGAATFPLVEAGIYMTIGNFFWITLAFRLGKTYGDRVIRRAFSQKAVSKVHSLIDKLHNRKSFLLVRILLFPLEDLLYFAAGMSRLPYRIFLLISLPIATAQMIAIMRGVDFMIAVFEGRNIDLSFLKDLIH